MLKEWELVSLDLLDYKSRLLLKVTNRDEGHLNRKLCVDLDEGERLVAAQVYTTGMVPVRIMMIFY